MQITMSSSGLHETELNKICATSEDAKQSGNFLYAIVFNFIVSENVN